MTQEQKALLKQLRWRRIVASANDRKLGALVTAGLAVARPLPLGQAQFRISYDGAITLAPGLASE